jgi:glycosyltransferase involved in cell wall biosynthesis
MIKYVIITPAKNEEKFIHFILESVCKQTLLPSEWIIVDDSSADNTVAIVEKYSATHNWIKLIKKTNYKEERSGGSKVVRAFKTGFNEITAKDYDFIVKLDSDLELPYDYFEKVLEAFCTDTKIGICGGRILNIYPDSTSKLEKVASYHIRGAFKAYRKQCFEEIGGLREVYNWDGVDEMLAMYYGWKTKTLDLLVRHLRPTSSLINRGIRSHFKAGKEYYKEGYDFFLASIKASVYSIKKKPRFLSGASFLLGFIFAFLKNESKYFDKEINSFCKSIQYDRVLNLRN